MDPTICLREACQAACEGDFVRAADWLRPYRSWRRRGGFEPLCVCHPEFCPAGADGDRLAELIEDHISNRTGETTR